MVAFLMNMHAVRGEIRYNESMAKHTSWRAGGPADVYFKPADIDDLANYLADLPEDEPLLWIGLGSNTMIRDGGFRGTVIAMQGVTSQLELLDEGTVYVGAGVPGAKLARFCEGKGLAGAEFFAGIPGLVGGALAMNAGAWGGETWNHVLSVETINRHGEVLQRDADEFRTAYRSVEGPIDEWFTAATLRFERREDVDSVVDIKALLARRAATQPVGTANSGSVFRNPPDDFAARLIEACGLKGHRIGGAVVSEKHANFIINEDKASATDIEDLIALAQQRVEQQFGIKLRPEVKIYGETLPREAQS